MREVGWLLSLLDHLQYLRPELWVVRRSRLRHGVPLFSQRGGLHETGSTPGTIFNTGFLSYAASRGFAVKACNVKAGNEKGRVERPIGFVRERFWPGRRFSDLMDLNVQALHWRDDFANVLGVWKRGEEE